MACMEFIKPMVLGQSLDARWNPTLTIMSINSHFAINHNSPDPNVASLQPLFGDFMHNLFKVNSIDGFAGTFNWPQRLWPFSFMTTQTIFFETYLFLQNRKTTHFRCCATTQANLDYTSWVIRLLESTIQIVILLFCYLATGKLRSSSFLCWNLSEWLLKVLKKWKFPSCTKTRSILRLITFNCIWS